MSNVTPITPKVHALTPRDVAIQRLAQMPAFYPTAAYVSAERLENIQRDMSKLLEIGQAIENLDEDAIEAIKRKIGVDISGIFDYAFSAHFELSVARETMEFVKQHIPSAG